MSPGVNASLHFAPWVPHLPSLGWKWAVETLEECTSLAVVMGYPYTKTLKCLIPNSGRLAAQAAQLRFLPGAGLLRLRPSLQVWTLGSQGFPSCSTWVLRAS